MFGNTQQGGGGKDQFVRLSGMFPTAKGNWIARIKPDAFPAIFELMKQANGLVDAQGNRGTLNLIVANNKQSGKPEIYAVVGQPYNRQSNQGGQPGPFGGSFGAQPVAPVPAPTANANPFAAPAIPTAQPVQGSRDVTFGKADVPQDDFDKLLENL